MSVPSSAADPLRVPGCSAPLLGSMEPGAGRLPLQVLGENEALQQFFSGELLNTTFHLLILVILLNITDPYKLLFVITLKHVDEKNNEYS